MSNAHPLLTVETLRAFEANPEVQRLRREVVARQVRAKRVRARVDSYIAPVFARFEFRNDLGVEHGEGPRILDNPRDLYLSKDEAQCAEFFAACDEAHRANGFDLPAGYCPALSAEHDVVKAENALLGYVESYFGMERSMMVGDLRERTLDLFLRGPRR